ncbi:MAG: hypothetical protein KF766_06555 [Rhodocyclaceae bacterium]|nr:hypothetical protein [Rhodocyclaceae bacterium]
MRIENIDTNLSGIAFDYFYWFSRFEFALKENMYLKSCKIGAKAEPGWGKFVEKWQAKYSVTPEANALLIAKPEQQIVARNADLDWAPVRLDDCKSDLAKVVRLLKTVRNNLFHGGKHGCEGWDDSKRTELLLSSGKKVLDQLAQLASLDADYKRYY